jgi:hypothetical protein
LHQLRKGRIALRENFLVSALLGGGRTKMKQLGFTVMPLMRSNRWISDIERSALFGFMI